MMSKEQIDELESQTLVPTTVFSRHVVLDLITMLRAKDEALMKAREFLVFAWAELGMSEYALNRLNDTIAAVDAAQGKQRVGEE